MQPNYLIAIKQDYTVYLSLILICSFIPVNQASIYDNLIVGNVLYLVLGDSLLQSRLIFKATYFTISIDILISNSTYRIYLSYL